MRFRKKHSIPLLLATALQAGSWSALPSIPRGQPAGISGDGGIVVARNRSGGMSWRSSVAIPGGSLAPSWNPLPSLPTGTAGSNLSRAPGGVVRGDLVAGKTADAIVYQTVGDGTVKRSVVAPSLVPDAFDHDGRRIVATFRDSSIYGRHLYLSVDSLASFDKSASGAIASASYAWRPLSLPSDIQFVSDCWIEGRLIVVSTDSSNWISRDTGATWTRLPLSDLYRVDMKGDTIVGASTGTKRLYVSSDAGASWDSSAQGSPLYLAFRGGALYGVFQQRTGAVYELARSVNLGKTWNTILTDVPTGNLGEIVAWDGASLWAMRGVELVRSENDGRTWTVADSGLEEGYVGKIRAYGNALLVLQNQKDPWLSLVPWNRLWMFAEGKWTLVRDSVVDIEVVDTGADRGVFALIDTMNFWPYGTASAHLALESTTDLRSWKTFTAVSPYSVALGISSQGVLVGEADGVAIVTPGARIARDTAWGPSGKIRLDGYGVLEWQDGRCVWTNLGNLQVRENGAVVAKRSYVGQYVSMGSKYGYAVGRNIDNAWMADFANKGVAYGLGTGGSVSGARRMRDSIAAWDGGSSFSLMRPEGQRVVAGPAGEGVTRVEWVSTSALGSLLTVVDSTFALADLHGRLWRWDRDGSSAAGRGTRNATRIVVRNGGLSLELDVDARVRIARFDARGRSLGVLVDERLARGNHRLALEAVPGITFAVATVDGNAQRAVAIPSSSR